ncbi:MAG TPA: DAK2 domain-containing protein [Terriglobales bacterium]|nr:DAK2 domain-containing protein [Terriglobales bacterium]
MNRINGDMLRDMILSGAHAVECHKNEINDLNVFPVPDGDTGTNMSLTLKAGCDALAGLSGKTCGEVASQAAAFFLKGARGNSGVITSLLFRGFAKELAGVEEMDSKKLAAAFMGGVGSAYKAVMKPTEGTILTVSRVAAEEGVKLAETEEDVCAVLKGMLKTAKQTLDKTPELLPVLKAAGVVDSGGMGYTRILEGMVSALCDGVIVEVTEPEAEKPQKTQPDITSLNPDDIKFAYCTEFFVNRTQKKLRPADQLRAYLDKLGDSLVFVDDGEVIKVHVHSNAPGRVLQEALKYGYLSGMKIENMVEQYGEFVEQMKESAGERVIATPEKRYGFVAVSPGHGITDVLRDLSVDRIVSGGQTMNPSTEDILAAVDATPAENIYIFPNNKNIILTAEMTAKLTDKKVFVVPTKTVPEGITAIMSFDETAGPQENFDAMRAAMKNVRSGSVTYAVRDTVVSDKKVKKGDMMGIEGSNVRAVEKTAEKAAAKLLAAMVGDATSFVTVFYGEDVAPQTAEKFQESLQKKYGDRFDMAFTAGGQPVYSYIIAVE